MEQVVQVAGMEQEQEQGVQQWAQEAVLVKYVSTDYSYNSSKSKIAACAPVPEKSKKFKPIMLLFSNRFLRHQGHFNGEIHDLAQEKYKSKRF